MPIVLKVIVNTNLELEKERDIYIGGGKKISQNQPTRMRVVLYAEQEMVQTKNLLLFKRW